MGEDILIYLIMALGFSIFFWPYLIEKYTGKRYVAVSQFSNRTAAQKSANNQLKREQLIASINFTLMDLNTRSVAMGKFNNSNYAKTILNLYSFAKDEYRKNHRHNWKEIDPYLSLTSEKQWEYKRNYSLLIELIEAQYGMRVDNDQREIIISAFKQFEPSL